MVAFTDRCLDAYRVRLHRNVTRSAVKRQSLRQGQFLRLQDGRAARWVKAAGLSSDRRSPAVATRSVAFSLPLAVAVAWLLTPGRFPRWPKKANKTTEIFAYRRNIQ